MSEEKITVQVSMLQDQRNYAGSYLESFPFSLVSLSGESYFEFSSMIKFEGCFDKERRVESEELTKKMNTKSLLSACNCRSCYME